MRARRCMRFRLLVFLLMLLPLMLVDGALSRVSHADTGYDALTSLLDNECTTLQKDKLQPLIEAQLQDEIAGGISPDLLRIMTGVIKRTDFDGISEEKTAEIIGLVNGAYKKGAPLEQLDELFDVAYVDTVSVDQLSAAAKALKEFSDSDVPQDIYEEFVIHFIENGWDPAAMPVLTRGLIYGTDRGLSPDKTALIIMLDVDQGELKTKTPEQLVLNSLKLVREKEPGNWKPMSQVEKETAERRAQKQELERKKQELDDQLGQKERAMVQAQAELKELREYPDRRPEGIDQEKVNRDLEALIAKLQGEIAQYQNREKDVIANLAAVRKDVERQQAIKDRERKEKRERDLAKKQTAIAGRGKQGRLNADKLVAAVNRWIGTTYRFGGDSERGIDCSAFTRRVYRSQDVELPRTSREQARVTTGEAYGSIKTGDLIFFDTSINGTISHVGVYLGNNVFAHASSSKGVTRSSIKEKYYVKRFVKGGRVFAN